MILAAILLVVYLPMLAEARRAAVNERAQRGRRAISTRSRSGSGRSATTSLSASG